MVASPPFKRKERVRFPTDGNESLDCIVLPELSEYIFILMALIEEFRGSSAGSIYLYYGNISRMFGY